MIGSGRHVVYVEGTHQMAHFQTLIYVTPIKTGHIKPQFSIHQTMSLAAITSSQSTTSNTPRTQGRIKIKNSNNNYGC